MLLTEDDLRLIHRLFKWGMRCFQMLGQTTAHGRRATAHCMDSAGHVVVPQLLLRGPRLAGGGVGSGGTAHITVDEERDMLDVFAGVFTVLEPHYFRDVFQHSMKFMFGT